MRTLASLLLLVGCAAGEGGDPTGALTAAEEAWPAGLAIGTGDVAFEPLVEGDPLILYRGAAGHYYVLVGGAVRGMSDEVGVLPTLSLVDGTALASPSFAKYMGLLGFDETACTGEFWGVWAELDDARGDLELVCSLEGVPVELAVEVTNLGTGAVVSGSLDLVIALDETAQALCP